MVRELRFYFGPTIPRRDDWARLQHAHALTVAERLRGSRTSTAEQGWANLLAALEAHLEASRAVGIEVRDGAATRRLEFTGETPDDPGILNAYWSALVKAGGLEALDRLAASGPGVGPAERYLLALDLSPLIPDQIHVALAARTLFRAIDWQMRRPECTSSEFIDHAHRLLTLSAAVAPQGGIVEFLISNVIEIGLYRAICLRLAEGRLPETAFLTELRQAILAAPSPSLAETLEAERFYTRQVIDNRLTDTLVRDKSRTVLALSTEDCFAWAIETVKMKPMARSAAVAKGPSRPPEKGSVAEILAPKLDKVVASSDECDQARSAALLSLAALEFKAKYARLPATLAELVPEFLPTVPCDPMTGAEFVYRLAPQSPGFVIFSLGSDGVEDGAGDPQVPGGPDAADRSLMPWSDPQLTR
jgi:hypothetical protein